MENIFIVIASIAIIGLAIGAIYEFIILSRDKQIEKVKEWLLLAVIQAEKELGSKTGQVKLRYVYDLFITKFKFISSIISFTQFSNLVDQSLDTMRDMIANNKNLENYINKE